MNQNKGFFWGSAVYVESSVRYRLYSHNISTFSSKYENFIVKFSLYFPLQWLWYSVVSFDQEMLWISWDPHRSLRPNSAVSQLHRRHDPDSERTDRSLDASRGERRKLKVRWSATVSFPTFHSLMTSRVAPPLLLSRVFTLCLPNTNLGSVPRG